jgi:hypothetical protein
MTRFLISQALTPDRPTEVDLVGRRKSTGCGTRSTTDHGTRERRADERAGNGAAGSTDSSTAQGAVAGRMTAGAEAKKASKGDGERA